MARSNNLEYATMTHVDARPLCPDHLLVVDKYATLEDFIRAFAAGYLNMLLIVGLHGLQKTRLVREVVNDRAILIQGRVTAFGLYCTLYEHRDRTLILDDVDDLAKDRDAVRLLKALLQTEPVKTVGWLTQAAERADLPTQFETRSRALIITNDWQVLDANVAALQDRCHALSFKPSALEVHIRTAGWYWDQVVYDFIGAHLGLIVRPSMRHYVRAGELKRAGLPWRDLMLTSWLTGNKLLAAQLRADPSFPSESERVRAFIARGGGCRASYYNCLKSLPPTADPPRLILTNPPPEETSPGPLDVIDLLRQRHRRLGEG
jgi:hypothetical protein